MSFAQEAFAEGAPFCVVGFPFAVDDDALVIRGQRLAREAAVDAEQRIGEVLDFWIMIADAGVIVGRSAEEDFFAFAPGEDFGRPVGHEVLVGSWDALGGVVHHDGELVGATGDFAKIFFIPMHIRIRMPPRGRRVGSDGKDFALWESGAEFVEQCEKICVAGGEWFHVDLDARESRMSVEEVADVRRKGGAPLWFVDARAGAVRAADPWDHAEVLEGIEEAFDLRGVEGRERAFGRGGTEVREDIRDVMFAEFGGEFSDARRIAKTRELVGLIVFGEPNVSAEPAVAKPDGVAAAIVATVADVEAGFPEYV